MKNKVIISSLLLSMLSGYAFAQKADSIIYRYKDASGKTIYTDRIPANLKVEVDVLSSKTGVLKRTIEKQLTEEEFQRRLAEDEAKKNAVAKSDVQIRQDQILLNTYSSVADIERMKSYEKDQLDRAIQNDINNVAQLMDRKNFIDREIQKNPASSSLYVDESKRIAENVANIENNLKRNREMLVERTKKYDDDKKRYEQIMAEVNAAKTSAAAVPVAGNAETPSQ